MSELIDGKAVAQKVRAEVRARVKTFYEKYAVKPKLSVILVGDDPASKVYVANKQKACEKVGIESDTHVLGADTKMPELLSLIDTLNADKSVNGILVQLPLPKGLDPDAVTSHIAPEKDVDGLTPVNAGLLFEGRALLEPCTPSGCIELLKRYEVPLAGAKAVIIGRSKLVGKPLAVQLLRENCTVSLCHSKTMNVSEYTKNADIVVCATGRPGLLTGDMVKPGAVVLDVGITRMADGSLSGDADFESVSKVAGLITPVPGGVGPMTIAMLVKNTIIAAEAQNG